MNDLTLFNETRWHEASAMFENMEDMIERSLQSYKGDFYVYERNYLLNYLFKYHTLGQEYVWAVQGPESYICALNISPEVEKDVEVCAQLSQGGYRFFHIDKDGVKEILPTQVLSLLGRSTSYELKHDAIIRWSPQEENKFDKGLTLTSLTNDGLILKNGQPLLQAEFVLQRGLDEDLSINLSTLDGSAVTLKDKITVALFLNEGGLVKNYGYLTKISNLTLDGQGLLEQVDLMGYQAFLQDIECEQSAPHHVPRP